MSSSLLEALALAGITSGAKEKREDDPLTTALKFIKYQKKLETIAKKEEEERKKKEAEHKFKLPTFSIWQLFILGPIVGFAYLFVFHKILEATVKLLVIH